MANDAFALSPLNARASLPTEADYAAISDAFMETARGRWFLGEYAKRNRNADTRMVLDAMSRLESALARQKPAPNPLDEALLALVDALAETRTQIATLLVRKPDAPSLEPVHQGTRAISEIAWTLRECGADTRICDLLDAQVIAIHSGCHQVIDTAQNNANAGADVLAAFDAMALRIRALAKGDHSQPAAETAATQDVGTPIDGCETSVAFREPPSPERAAPHLEQTTDYSPSVDTASSNPTIEDPAVQNPISEHEDQTPITISRSEISAVPEMGSVEQREQHPQEQPASFAAARHLVIDPVATPDVDILEHPSYDNSTVESRTIDNADIDDTAELSHQEIAAAESPANNLADDDAIVAGHSTPPEAQPIPAPHAAIAEPVVSTVSSSLGQALIDNGVIRNPGVARGDPLALIHRMSQAEKIAFFS